MKETCPLCGADLRGEPIPQEYLDKGYYAPESTHYSRRIGVEIQGVYDGVLFYQCPDCAGRWHRFPEGDRLNDAARPYIEAAKPVEEAA